MALLSECLAFAGSEKGGGPTAVAIRTSDRLFAGAHAASEALFNQILEARIVEEADVEPACLVYTPFCPPFGHPDTCAMAIKPDPAFEADVPDTPDTPHVTHDMAKPEPVVKLELPLHDATKPEPVVKLEHAGETHTTTASPGMAQRARACKCSRAVELVSTEHAPAPTEHVSRNVRSRKTLGTRTEIETTKRSFKKGKSSRRSGGREPTGKPLGRIPGPGLQIPDDELFMYAMFHGPWTAKLKKQYIVTTNAVWRKLQAMLQRLANDGRLQDPRLLEKKGTRLNLDIKRLKAEGVDSWEAFTDKYLSGHRP